MLMWLVVLITLHGVVIRRQATNGTGNKTSTSFSPDTYLY